MTLFEFRRHIIKMHDNINRDIERDIEETGGISPVNKGRKLNIIDVLILIDGFLAGSWD